MKVVIATPLYPPDIGGPATYARGMEEEFTKRAITVVVVSFHTVRNLPKGISHIVYGLKLLSVMRGATAIIALDPLAVGLPAIFAATLFRVPLVARIGGDTLWERYVNRTKHMVPLSRFYQECLHRLDIPERLIFFGVKFFVRHIRAICFSSAWQQAIWSVPYQLSPIQAHVVDNTFPAIRHDIPIATKKVFLWAGRDIPLKNLAVLKSAFSSLAKTHPDISLEVVHNVTHDVLLEKMKSAYALVLPSLTDITPNFILEGVSLGKPFVMTKETGIQDGARDFGIFIDPMNEEELKVAIVSLAEPATYEAYRAKILAHKSVRTYDNIVTELMSILKKSVAT